MEHYEEPAEVISPEETPAPAPQERDFDAEVQDLFAARPELRGQNLPGEVLTACVGGKRLTDAYNDYARANMQDAAELRQENRILRQNAKAAAQAPVRGVTHGGSTNAKPEDAFLRGFNAVW